MNLSLSLSLGSAATQGARARRAKPETDLCAAAGNKVFVTLKFEGEELTFAPLAVYEGTDGEKYVIGFQQHDLPGNRPPALEGLPLAGVSAVVATSTAFTVHPRHKPILLGLQSVQCAVELV